MAPRSLIPEARLESYRRLSGAGGESLEELVREVRARREAETSSCGGKAGMEPKVIRYFWQPRPRKVARPTWETVALHLLVSGLAGSLAVIAVMGS